MKANILIYYWHGANEIFPHYLCSIFLGYDLYQKKFGLKAVSQYILTWTGNTINTAQFKHSQIVFLSFYSDKQVKQSWKWGQNYTANMQHVLNSGIK